MKGICGYGRYNDDPEYVGCPRAQSDMTPCVARDGKLALSDAPEEVCVGCGSNPLVLLQELRDAGVKLTGKPPKFRTSAAQRLRWWVRNLTEDLLPR